VPIYKASATFIPPDGVAANVMQQKGFVGAQGVNTPAQSYFDGNNIIFNASPLAPRSGLTMLVNLPENLIEKPPFLLALWWLIADWLPIVMLPLLTFGTMYYYYTTR